MKIQTKSLIKEFRENPNRQFLMCDYAANILKKAGFILHYTSMQSEACYYKFPDKEGLIRVAGHRYGRRARNLDKNLQVICCITFPENYFPRSIKAVESIIIHAVGYFFLFSSLKEIKDVL